MFRSMLSAALFVACATVGFVLAAPAANACAPGGCTTNKAGCGGKCECKPCVPATQPVAPALTKCCDEDKKECKPGEPTTKPAPTVADSGCKECDGKKPAPSTQPAAPAVAHKDCDKDDKDDDKPRNPTTKPAPAVVTLAVMSSVNLETAAGATDAPKVEVIDVGNTKCLLMPDDNVDATKFVVYQGKKYHFCCGGCVKKFNKDPEKYVKAFEADPAKYGVTK